MVFRSALIRQLGAHSSRINPETAAPWLSHSRCAATLRRRALGPENSYLPPLRGMIGKSGAMTNFLLFLILLALPGGAAILSALVGMAAFAVLAVGVVILLVVVAASLIANPDALVVIGSVALIVLGLTLATAGVQKSKNLVEAKFGKRAWELTVQRAASAMAVALVIGVWTIAAYAQGGLRGYRHSDGRLGHPWCVRRRYGAHCKSGTNTS